MNIAKNLERLRRRTARIWSNGPIILMYHHVGEPTEDPWNLAVSPRHFREQQSVLQDHRATFSLREFAELHADGRLPRDAAAVTFDDGYASNLHWAKPTLEQFGVPATVFVSSGFLDNSEEPWWDELATLLLGPTELPEVLRLSLDRRECTWRPHEWTAPRRRDVHNAIHRLLVRSPQAVKQHTLTQLRSLVRNAPWPNDARRPLTSEELCRLADGTLIEIGAHTATHPSLPCLTPEMQYDEIRTSKNCLEEHLGTSVRGFAYPYGDHDEASVRAVIALGFSYACMTAQGFVDPRDTAYRFPRFTVEDWDGEEFARRFVPAHPVTRLFPGGPSTRRVGARPDRSTPGLPVSDEVDAAGG